MPCEIREDEARRRNLLVALLAGSLSSPFLGGCVASAVSARPPTAQSAASSCTLRAVVTVRRGSTVRNDSDLVDLARRLGVHLDVLQSMGSTSKMVVFRENGPEAYCEEALSALRSDLRIESVERY